MSQFPVRLQVILYVMKVIYLACTKKCWSGDFFFQKKVSTPYNAGTNTVKPRFEVENLEPYGKTDKDRVRTDFGVRTRRQ